MESTSVIELETIQPGWGHYEFNVTITDDKEISVLDVSYWLEVRKHPAYRAAVTIYDNHPFILCGIGVPFNMLSFLVLRRIKPLTSAILVMMILALMDSLKLIVECSNRVAELNAVSFTTTGCGLIMPIRYSMQYIPIWLVVLLTIERIIAVCFPLKAATLCTISNARRALLFLFILDVLICVVHTFVYVELAHPRGYGCWVKTIYISFMEKWMIIDVLFFVVIPLVVLCLGNFAIIVKLRTSRGITSASDSGTQDEETKRQNRSVTIMLLAVCITTIVCLLPNSVLSLTDLIGFSRTYTGDIATDAFGQLANRIIGFLTDTNNAVNFFLYVLSGRRFRSALREMLLSWLGKQETSAQRRI